jgi:mono/diheme cytochrome c family protein
METTMRRLVIGLMAGALAIGVATSAAAQDAKVATGAKLFEANKCSICHSVAGKGNVKKPLDGAGARLDAAMIRLWLTDPKAAEAKAGKKAMPPMKSFAALPPADIDALVAYVQSLK